MKTDLHIAFCSHAAARYAVMNWHYSRCMPAGKLVRVGVWEGGEFIGAVLFGRGANRHMSGQHGLKMTECAELVRVALREHEAEVSRIVSIAVRLLRRQSPGLRLLVSYADPAQGHHGGIYQAMNWIYLGESTAQRELLVNGRFMHKRTAHSRWGTAAPEAIQRMTGKRVEYGPREWKHTYLLPLDNAMRRQLEPQAQPYPKRGRSNTSDAPGVQPGEGGATPTRPLQSSEAVT